MSNNDKTMVFGSDQNKNNDQERLDNTSRNQGDTVYGESPTNDESVTENPNKTSNRKKIIVGGAGIAATAGISGFAYGSSTEPEMAMAAEGNDVSLADEFAGIINQPQETETSNLHQSTKATSSNAHHNGSYEVSFLDNDNDGITDSLTVNGRVVSPENIHYPSASGMVENELELANVSDYVQDGANMADTMSYEIQAGDTLSEIAQTNHTTIDHIMALNPQISDADLIYAGNNLVIPTNDNESNPYANWDGDANTQHLTIEPSDALLETVPVEEPILSETEFSNTDWSSFEDQPMEQYTEEELIQGTSEDYSMSTSYENEFSQTDFNSYQSPEGYYDADFGNDVGSSDFV
jgi:LysM repeat protein